MSLNEKYYPIFTCIYLVHLRHFAVHSRFFLFNFLLLLLNKSCATVFTFTSDALQQGAKLIFILGHIKIVNVFKGPVVAGMYLLIKLPVYTLLNNIYKKNSAVCI